MHILDDVTLIQQFINGEATLAANQKLRIEPAFDSIQLLAKRGGLIATIKRLGSRQTVLLRQASDYSSIVRQVLRAKQFVPVLDAGQPGFEEYRADEIPAGYTTIHTPAKVLWKEWWRTARHSGHGIQMDILIFARDTWYPVRNIVCSQGLLFITTLVNELTLDGNEQITWLRRLPPSRFGGVESLATPAYPQPLQASSTPTQPINPRQERDATAKSPTPLSKRETSNHERGTSNRERGTSNRDLLGNREPVNRATGSELKQVLQFRDGKLYVTTALGDIVVEGNHLKFRLEDEPMALDSQKPISLNGYRDREGRAVNH